jgi:hypothetical protein
VNPLQRRAVAITALLIALGCWAPFAQEALQGLGSGATAIQALIKVRGAIGAAAEAGELKELRFWLRLAERGLPGKRVLWLWPNERLLLAFWLGEYQTALDAESVAPAAAAAAAGSAGPRTYLPSPDLLFHRLQAASAGRREQLKEAVRGSGLSQDERYFLLLLLDYLLKLDPIRQEEQLELNRAAAYYLRRFPGSRYGTFVASKISAPVPRPSPWAVGFDGGPAFGMFLGELSRDFNAGWGASGGVEVSYRRLIAGGRMQWTTPGTERQLSYGGIWDAGIDVTVIAPELSLGYLLVASRRFKLAPYLGTGWLAISPETDTMMMSWVGPSLWVPTYLLGLDMDFRINVLSTTGARRAPRTSLVLRTHASVAASLEDIAEGFEPICLNLAVLLQIRHRPLRE